MAVVKIKLTKDILTLVNNFKFQRVPDLRSDKYPMTWGLDFYSLYGGSYLLEDMAYILGIYDKHIKGTEEDPLGPQFPKETEDYLLSTHAYILENIEYIEDLIHYFSNKGGLTEGTYKCLSHQKVWEKVE